MPSNSTQINTEVLHPDVLWTQKPDSVKVTFNLQDIQNPSVDVAEQKLSFSGTSGGRSYAAEIEFYDKVKPDTLVKVHTGRCFSCEIKKETSSKDLWPRLISSTEKQHWLRVDFSSFVDYDAEDEDEFPKMYPGPELDSYRDMGINFDDIDGAGNSDDNLDDGSSESASSHNEETASKDAVGDANIEAVSGEKSSTGTGIEENKVAAAEVSL